MATSWVRRQKSTLRAPADRREGGQFCDKQEDTTGKPERNCQSCRGLEFFSENMQQVLRKACEMFALEISDPEAAWVVASAKVEAQILCSHSACERGAREELEASEMARQDAAAHTKESTDSAVERAKKRLRDGFCGKALFGLVGEIVTDDDISEGSRE